MHRYAEEVDQARSIQQALKGKFNEAQRLFQLGCLAYDEEQLDDAEQLMQQAIEQQNDFVPAHEALNKLYWEHGLQSQFLT